MFECWYTLEPEHTSIPNTLASASATTSVSASAVNNVERMYNVERMLAIIPEGEYDLIDSFDDITDDPNIPLTSAEKQQVYEQIQARKLKGGKRKHKRKQKHTKRQLFRKKRKTIKRRRYKSTK